MTTTKRTVGMSRCTKRFGSVSYAQIFCRWKAKNWGWRRFFKPRMPSRGRRPEYLMLPKSPHFCDNLTLGLTPMPQIDFGQAFSTPDKDAPSAWPSAQSGQLESARGALMEHKPAELPGGARFGRPEWANVAFATVTFVGGLFCAFYFFNGAELLRAAAAGPAELLYSRPAITASGDVDDEAFPIGPNSAASTDGGGDPFSRCSGLMSLTLPSTIGWSGAGAELPSSATAANAGSPLVRLGFPAPGGDALTRAFDSAVGDLARLSSLEAHRTVALTQTAVGEIKKRTSSGN